VEKNGSKMWGRSSSLMPAPVSETAMLTVASLDE
jgi:hypothetical protein